MGVRIWVDFIEETSAVVFVEDTGETPGLFLERLHVLDLDDQNVARLGVFDLEGAAEVMDLGEIDVLHIVGTVVVPNLSSGPVYAFNLDNLPVLDLFREWN